MDIKKPQLVKVEAFAVFLRNSSATPSAINLLMSHSGHPANG